MSEKIISQRGDANFDLTIPDDVPEVFVDGVSHSTFGLPYSKLIFHSVRPAEAAKEGVEARRAVLVLTIQTETLLEMCTKVVGTILENESQLSAGYKFLEGKLQAHLAAARAISARTKKGVS